MTPSASPSHDDCQPSLCVSTDGVAMSADARLLATCTFGTQTAPDAINHPHLIPLARRAGAEFWRGTEATTSGSDHGVEWRADAHLLFGHITVATNMGNTATATATLYRRLFACLEARDFPHLLRVWNFLPQINDGAGDAARYKAFCAGRAQAFDDCPMAQRQYPAATAIGIRTGQQLKVYFLAARTPGTRVENPRQVNAPEYPRQYGPRSPRFARATTWPRKNPSIMLASGTASITGHKSRHIGDPQAQLEEIWRNLQALQQQTGATRPASMRVYLVRESDYAIARDFLAAKLPDGVAPIYLQADICRPELLVEIESVYHF